MYASPLDYLTNLWDQATDTLSTTQADVMCGIGMVGDLCRATEEQIRLSRQGVGLPNALAGNPSQFLIDAPANNLGAAWRAAYWLAVASRVAHGRRDFNAQRILLDDAETAKNRAFLLESGKFSFGLFSVSPTGDRRVRKYLGQAEEKIRRQGIGDIANILSMQQQSSAIEQSQYTTEGQGTLSIPGLNPEGIVRAGVTGTAGIAIVSGVVLLGVGLWFVWPWIAPIFGLASGAVRTRSRQNKRRKRRRRGRR